MTADVGMNEGKQARRHDELIAELLDSRVPKTEREHAAAREIEKLREQQPEARGVVDARRLAVGLWQRHYREVAPEWEPCPDLAGLLSQIDNMVSGLTRAPVGVKTLSEFMAEQEALHPGIHDKVQAEADELRAGLAQQPAAEPRSTHRVWRMNDWLSCYCEALSDHHIGCEQPGSRSWMAEVCRAAALSLAAHGVRNEQLLKVADWIAKQPTAVDNEEKRRTWQALWLVLRQTGTVVVPSSDIVSADWSRCQIEQTVNESTGAVRFRAILLAAQQQEPKS